MMKLTELAYEASLPILLTAGGGYFGWRLRAELRPRRLAATLESTLRDRSARASLALALAGTLGVGNMAGVAGAVAIGGAGAVFWMLLSSLFAMALKYAETKAALACRVRDPDGVLHGGAMYGLKKGAGIAFAILLVICSFTLGDGIQVSAAAAIFHGVTGKSGMLPALAFAVLLPLVLLGGRRGIHTFAERAVPLMTGGYILLCLAVLLRNAAALPGVLRDILRSAFTLRAAAGAVPPALLAIRCGFTRGLVSNEAGCGTAPVAHAGSDRSPGEQAAMGVAEVFVDTTLLCTLTALAFLSCRPTLHGTADGTVLLLAAFRDAVGPIAPAILLPSVLLFAFATAVCWSFYGAEGIRFLLRNAPAKLQKTAIKCYFLLFSLSSVLLILPSGAYLWQLNDLLMAALTALNLFFLLSRRKSL